MSGQESQGMVKDTINDCMNFYDDARNFIESCQKPESKGIYL